MAKKYNFFQFAIILLGVIVFYSCEREPSTIDTQLENLILEAQEDIQLQTRSGGGECFELVWPITIQFSDDSLVEINEYEDIRQITIDWKNTNPNVRPKIRIVYPLEIITTEGDIISVDTRIELKEIRKECLAELRHDPRPCFRLIYPVSIEFTNGELEAFASREELSTSLRLWKKKNPTAIERPHLSFPLIVKLKDGTTMMVDNEEALFQLKKDC